MGKVLQFPAKSKVVLKNTGAFTPAMPPSDGVMTNDEVVDEVMEKLTRNIWYHGFTVGDAEKEARLVHEAIRALCYRLFGKYHRFHNMDFGTGVE